MEQVTVMSHGKIKHISRYVSMVSAGSVVAVYDRKSKTNQWLWDIVEDNHYEAALNLYPRYNINRKKYIQNAKNSVSGGYAW